jgi:hypothetical protein
VFRYAEEEKSTINEDAWILSAAEQEANADVSAGSVADKLNETTAAAEHHINAIVSSGSADGWWQLSEEDQVIAQHHSDLAVRRVWWAWIGAIAENKLLKGKIKNIEDQIKSLRSKI